MKLDEELMQDYLSDIVNVPSKKKEEPVETSAEEKTQKVDDAREKDNSNMTIAVMPAN